MKKLSYVIIIILIVSCKETIEWSNSKDHFSLDDITNQWVEWIEDPNKLIVDMSPVLMQAQPIRIVRNGDTTTIVMDEYHTQKAKELEEFNNLIWSKIVNIDEVVEKSYIILKNDPKNFYFKFLDMTENITYSIILTAPIMMIPGAQKNVPQKVVALELISTKLMKTYKMSGIKIFLERGNLDYGLEHILYYHTPDSYFRRGIFDNKNCNKSLFLRSDEQYIMDLLDRFTNSDMLIYNKELSIGENMIYDCTLISDCGAARQYRLVVSKETNCIVTFYPMNKVPVEYLGQEYMSYAQLQYGRKRIEKLQTLAQ